MITTTVFPGRYIQGFDTIYRLGDELKRLGNSAFFICTSYVHNLILPSIEYEIIKKITISSIRFGGECSAKEIERLTNEAGAAGSDVIVGFGGGKTLDTAKVVAANLDLPCAIVPSIASSDAPCSACSIIYSDEGTFKSVIQLKHNPDLVLVDSQIIAEAPPRFLIAGMGDALSTFFEAESCRLTGAKNSSGDYPSLTGFYLSKLCCDTLLKYGRAAVQSVEAKSVTPALDYIIEANTLLSGLGFENGGLAAAHSIHNGLTALKQTYSYLHGEKVAFGTLASLFLTGKPQNVIDEVYGFCKTVGLPVKFADIGLEGVSDLELHKVGEKACDEGEGIYNESRQISPESVAAALKCADAEGRRRG